MSFKHGSNAAIIVNGSDLSAYFNSMDLKAESDTAESTTFQRDWKTYIPGTAGGTMDLGGYYDPALAGTSPLRTAAGDLILAGPAGLSTLGDLCRILKVRGTSYSESSPVGGIVAFKSSVLADGSIGFGNLLHRLSDVETSDGSETSFAGPVGGSSNGGVAHLHVSAVADSVVVTIEHSTNNADWTTLVTFTSASAAGAERIEVSGTVNRYLRATWDITGASPSATFAVAMARL